MYLKNLNKVNKKMYLKKRANEILENMEDKEIEFFINHYKKGE